MVTRVNGGVRAARAINPDRDKRGSDKTLNIPLITQPLGPR